MSDSAFQKVLAVYLANGTVEEIHGNTVTSAEDWLEQAREELPGVAKLVEMKLYRMAYRTAYDLMRNSAEAIVTKAGYRVTSKSGHHEAIFALANALVSETSEAFSGFRSAQVRGLRSKSQYIDVNRNTEVDATEATNAYQWAAEAIATASSFLE